mmetsp:Transcript_32913/g.40464  ORF Transcript_32913/g.40464 Transcript_32913/m.40464 type:complete len:429 (-) Transcript_32913:18-1304(-)
MGSALDCNFCAPNDPDLTSSDDEDDYDLIISNPNGNVSVYVRDLLRKFENQVRNDKIKYAMLMIEEHRDINFFEYYFNNADTCLHYAVRKRNISFIYYLLSKGVNPDIQNAIKHDTPLHIATDLGDVRIISMLRIFGCDTEIKNLMDKTAYDIARDNGDTDAMFMFSDQIQSFFVGPQKDLPILSNQDSNLSIKLELFESNEVITSNDNDISYLSDKIDNDGNVMMGDYDDYSGGEYDFDSISLLSGNNSNNTISSKSSKDTNKTVNRRASSKDSINFEATNIVLKTICSIKMIEIPYSLNDWLLKLEICESKGNRYKSKYVWIQDLHICWHKYEPKGKKSKKLDFKQRYKYNGCLSLLFISKCVVYESRKTNSYKFILYTKVGKSETPYLFKCKSKQQRNKWINNINNYCDTLKIGMNNLKNSHKYF